MAITIDYKWSDKIVSPISKTDFSTKASNSIDTLTQAWKMYIFWLHLRKANFKVDLIF